MELWIRYFLFSSLLNWDKKLISNKINVFITIDVETSIGGAFVNPELKPVGSEKRIFGKIGNRYYGIPLIIDLLDQNNLKATFFVDVLNKYYFGEIEAKKVCQYIQRRGHDVQLHLHPIYLNFKNKNWMNLKEEERYSDIIADYSLDEQVKLIAEGKSLLIKYGIKNPIAFRAGGFGANRNTVIALKKNDFAIDSSYNIRYLGKNCFLDEEMKFNDVKEINSILEFPITSFLDFKLFSYLRFKPLDISGVSYFEVKKVLEKAKILGLQHIVIILHSFSFIKAKDWQYNRIKPDHVVTKRFKKLCNFLSSNSDQFKVLSFSEFYNKYYKEKNISFKRTGEVFPYVGFSPALFRKGIQVLNRFI